MTRCQPGCTLPVLRQAKSKSPKSHHLAGSRVSSSGSPSCRVAPPLALLPSSASNFLARVALISSGASQVLGIVSAVRDRCADFAQRGEVLTSRRIDDLLFRHSRTPFGSPLRRSTLSRGRHVTTDGIGHLYWCVRVLTTNMLRRRASVSHRRHFRIQKSLS